MSIITKIKTLTQDGLSVIILLCLAFLPFQIDLINNISSRAIEADPIRLLPQAIITPIETRNLDQTIRVNQALVLTLPQLPVGGALLPVTTFEIITNPSNGTYTTSPTGSAFVLTYTPNTDFEGNDSISWQQCYNATQCVTVNMNIRVGDGNTNPNPNPTPLPPVAITDTASLISTSQALTINVLSNDVEATGVTMTISSPATRGTATVSGTSISYQANFDFTTGSDTFEYQICRALLCSSAVVTVNAISIPLPTSLIAIADNIELPPNAVPLVIDVLANDTNVDNTVTIIISQAATRGTATINANNTINYIPNPGFTTGADTFEYRICKGVTDCSSAIVTVTNANNPQPNPNLEPVAVADSVELLPTTPLVINVLGNDTETEGVTMTISLQPNHGTAVINIDNTITYTVTPNGTSNIDIFQYTICKTQLLCSSALVTVNIFDPQNAIIMTKEDIFNVNQDSSIVINVLANDETIPANNFVNSTLKNISQVTNGTITIEPTGGLITYVPNPGFVGVDSFSYEICDTFSNCSNSVATIFVDAVISPEPINSPSNVTLKPVKKGQVLGVNEKSLARTGGNNSFSQNTLISLALVTSFGLVYSFITPQDKANI